MKDFIFRNDIRKTVSEMAQGRKVMFVYGGGSVKRNGCHADVVQALAENHIPFVEYGNL